MLAIFAVGPSLSYVVRGTPAVPTHARTQAILASAAAAPETTEVKKIVMKFGGSSVSDAERITEVCNLVKLQRASASI